ncbi:GNAT family N-acetyltransferase [Mucilaginibacter ginsenosidivorans]|uniref:GNAT family N-acetyltransferase n=2 Tax=Mucilaginibacter ginsenosidivorans TaxID=398053 RepID=A0A5B8V4G6_9SPHI|nr:GNAT family N-acetyltransferase [Mucilaginibacter ginsenosidivorans]
MNDKYFFEKGYSISTDKSLIDFDAVYNYLENESYWAKGVTAERLRKAIDNSMCFGIHKDGKQAGFARVVTDKATFAYLCDVFVLDAYRGIGLSKWLMQTIMEHPELKGLRRWSLATSDAHGLYQQFGFVPLSKPDNWMEIYTPYTQTQGDGK